MKFNKILIIIFFLHFCFNQGLLIEAVNPINNPMHNNLNLNQSFGFSVSNQSGVSTSNAIFANKLNYTLTPKINLESNLYFVSPIIQDYNNANNLNIQYDLLLDYKISENFQFKIKMTNMNYYNNFNSMKHSLFNE